VKRLQLTRIQDRRHAVEKTDHPASPSLALAQTVALRLPRCSSIAMNSRRLISPHLIADRGGE
jgi:hypothetical protein